MPKLIYLYFSVLILYAISCSRNDFNKNDIASKALCVTLSYFDSISNINQHEYGDLADTFLVTFNDTLFGPIKFEPQSKSWNSHNGVVSPLEPFHFVQYDLTSCISEFRNLVFLNSKDVGRQRNPYYVGETDSTREAHHVQIYIDGVYFVDNDFVDVSYTETFPRLFFETMHGSMKFRIVDDRIEKLSE